MRQLATLLLCLAAGAACAQAPAVAAASDLRFALDEAVAAFEKDTRRRVRAVYGSSGNFYTQIRQGAPFELFLSADEDFVFKLASAGRTEDRGVPYAIGRIVLFAPASSTLKVDARLEGLRDAVARGAVKRFAIANPGHAPY